MIDDQVAKDYQMVRIARITPDEIGDYQSAVKEYNAQRNRNKDN